MAFKRTAIALLACSWSVKGFAPSTPRRTFQTKLRTFASSGHDGDSSGGQIDISALTKKAFADVEWDVDLDDETRAEFEASIAADFDRTLKELEVCSRVQLGLPQ